MIIPPMKGKHMAKAPKAVRSRYRSDKFMMTSLQTMSMTPKGILRRREIRGVNPKDCQISLLFGRFSMCTDVDDQRPKDTDTTLDCQLQYRITRQTHIRYIHKHGEHEIQVGSRIKEGLPDLIPLPRVISDTLGVTADTVDCD
jgi:hypothetical protein